MYNNVAELEADGFSQTPEVFHSGKGDGKIYAKSVANENGDGGFHYVHYSVDPDGAVQLYEAVISPKVEEAKAEPEVKADNEVQEV